MALDTIKAAKKFMSYRQFDKAIELLEARSTIFEDNFSYYLMLGTACLYAGDIGSASTYYQKARSIRMSNVNLLLGQAVIFLRRGETDRAINYYFDVLESDPSNKIAKNAMEFIRHHGDYETICRWVDTKKIEQFYPPIGLNPYKIIGITLPIIACLLGCLIAFRIVYPYRTPPSPRADLSAIVLTVDERKNALEKDLSSGAFSYILTASEVSSAYDKAHKSFQQYRDNLAQIEINRILNSNASVAVKQKARVLMGYIDEPTFDSLRDSVDYTTVEKEPALYLDCWVIWSGRISNVSQTETTYSFDLVVGYESLNNPVIKGIVPVKFSVPPVIVPDKPVKVLGKISSDSGKLYLVGKHIYQSVNE